MTSEFMACTPANFEALAKQTTSLPVPRIKMLQRLRLWAGTGRHLVENDWKDLTLESLVAATDDLLAETTESMQHRGSGNTSESRLVSTAKRSAAETYKARVKISTAAYEEFKQDDKFRQWARKTRATAKNQGIDRVFDPEFNPESAFAGDDDGKEEFKYQEATVMEILVNNCKTINSLAIVRRHEAKCTAHACFKEMHKYYLTGKNAERAAEKAETAVRDMRLDGNWDRTYTAFLLKWENNLLDLEEYTGETIKDEIRKKWLTASLRTHDLFRQEMSSAGRILDAQGKDRDFTEWFAQIKEFAADTDDVVASKKIATRKVKANKAQSSGSNAGSTG